MATAALENSTIIDRLEKATVYTSVNNAAVFGKSITSFSRNSAQTIKLKQYKN